MNSKMIQFALAGIASWISLLLMITTTYGASIVIGGDYTEIGTIVVISPKPGNTPQNNGTALLNNLADITADVNNPYVIKLGPGIYDIGTGSLQMKEYVDVEGSGENTTIITGQIDSHTSGVVQGVNNAEIRFLTIRNTGGGTDAVAIYANGLDILLKPSTFKITHITASASGGGTTNYGINNYSSSPTMTNVNASAKGGVNSNSWGVYNDSSSPTMTNMTVSASGGPNNYGVENSVSSPTMTNMTVSASGGPNNYGVGNTFSSSPTMTNVTVSASGGGRSTNVGVYDNNSSTTMINNSVIIGSTYTLYNDINTTTRVANTKLDGGAVINAGTLTCVGAYNGSYVALDTSCQ